MPSGSPLSCSVLSLLPNSVSAAERPRVFQSNTSCLAVAPHPRVPNQPCFRRNLNLVTSPRAPCSIPISIHSISKPAKTSSTTVLYRLSHSSSSPTQPPKQQPCPFHPLPSPQPTPNLQPRSTFHTRSSPLPPNFRQTRPAFPPRRFPCAPSPRYTSLPPATCHLCADRTPPARLSVAGFPIPPSQQGTIVQNSMAPIAGRRVPRQSRTVCRRAQVPDAHTILYVHVCM